MQIATLGLNTVPSHDVEEDLFSQVKSMRNEGVPVTRNSLRMMALAVVGERGVEDFVASETLLSNLCHRFSLNLRVATRQCQ